MNVRLDLSLCIHGSDQFFMALVFCICLTVTWPGCLAVKSRELSLLEQKLQQEVLCCLHSRMLIGVIRCK